MSDENGVGGVAPDGARPGRFGAMVVWLNAERCALPLPTAGSRLLDVLAAHGIPHTLRARPWADPVLADEPLLVAVGPLVEPIEIVHNGALATVGIAHLRVAAGDEVVIGEAGYLRARFEFFR